MSRARWLWRVARVVLGFGLVAFGAGIAWSRREELGGVRPFLEHVHWQWIALAVVAEVASIVSFAAMSNRLIRAGGASISLPVMTGITFAGNALANSLPGGAAWGSVFAYRQFKRRGSSTALAAWVIVGITGLSAATLALLSVVGIEAAGTEGPASNLRVVAVVVLLLGVGLVVVFRRPGLMARLAETALRLTKRVTRRPRRDPVEIIEGVQARMTAIRPTTADWTAAGSFSLLSWLADCSCLCMAFVAVGAPVPIRGLLLAYGAGQLAANLPLTPGGLGVVEGSLALALVAYGGAEEATVAAVLLYRIISFWLLLRVGWSAWGILELAARRRKGER